MNSPRCVDCHFLCYRTSLQRPFITADAERRSGLAMIDFRTALNNDFTCYRGVEYFDVLRIKQLFGKVLQPRSCVYWQLYKDGAESYEGNQIPLFKDPYLPSWRDPVWLVPLAIFTLILIWIALY